MTALRALKTHAANSIDHAMVLMARESITPNDAGCQTYLIHRLQKAGFVCQQHHVNGVSNLIARWGTGIRHFAFCGHTDVVPPGPLELWNSDPFSPVLNNNILYGRGAADMKTGVAAMLAASERILKGANPDELSYWWFITSDEEGEAEDGSKWIKAWLDEQGIIMDMCLIGEPTAQHHTGDAIKIGRRGSLSATVHITGKQGHVAYPHSCDNAIHKASHIIQSLLSQAWQGGTADFPGTSLQITHVDTGKFTDNLAPGKARIEFNVRYAAEFTQTSLEALLLERIHAADKSAQVTFSRPCKAYLSQPGEHNCLINMVEQAIVNTTGRYPLITTSGGTSDGRFFAGPNTQVVEVGVPNASIHQVNEHVHLSDLVTLEDIYTDILSQLTR